MSELKKKHSILGLVPLINALQHQGLDPEPLLRKHGINLDAMSASTMLDVPTQLAIIKDALSKVNDPVFGLTVGSEVTITSYGIYALLLMSAPNIKALMEASIKYQRLSLNFTETTVNYLQGYVEVRSLLPDIHGELRHFVADRDYSGNAVFIREMLEEHPHLISACGIARPYPGEKHVPQFTRQLNLTPQFDQSCNWIRVPVAALTIKSKHSNPLAHKLFEAQAQSLLHEHFSDSGDIVSRINLLLDGAQHGYPKFSELAEHFNTSESTLRRHLANIGTNFREVLESHRHKRTLAILEVESPSVNDLAERLGYADAMGFVKAFKKWTGLTPKQYMLTKAR